MQFDVRPYEEADEAGVVAVWRDVFSYSAPHNDPQNVVRQKRAYDRALFFVAVADGDVIGTVMGGYDGHRGWIYSLAVRHAARGQGIGTVLMRRVEHQLAEMGCQKINLQLLATNSAAVEFYPKLGYAVEERVSMGKLLVHTQAADVDAR